MPPIEHGDGVDVSGGDVRQDRPADAGTAVRSGSQTTVTSFFEARKVRQRAPSARAKEGASSPKEAQSKPTVRRAAEATKEKDTAPGDELASDSNCAEGQGAEEDSADTAARKSDDNSSAAATDDVDQGVELLQLLFSAPSATQDRATAAATGRGKGAGAAGGKSSAAKVEAGDGGPPDHKDWAWERSCHDGLLTFHDGRKRWSTPTLPPPTADHKSSHLRERSRGISCRGDPKCLNGPGNDLTASSSTWRARGSECGVASSV